VRLLLCQLFRTLQGCGRLETGAVVIVRGQHKTKTKSASRSSTSGGRPILAKWLERKELGEWGDLKNEKKMKVEMHEVGKLGIGGP
jgi:hypothetical protein